MDVTRAHAFCSAPFRRVMRAERARGSAACSTTLSWNSAAPLAGQSGYGRDGRRAGRGGGPHLLVRHVSHDVRVHGRGLVCGDQRGARRRSTRPQLRCARPHPLSPPPPAPARAAQRGRPPPARKALRAVTQGALRARCATGYALMSARPRAARTAPVAAAQHAGRKLSFFT